MLLMCDVIFPAKGLKCHGIAANQKEHSLQTSRIFVGEQLKSISFRYLSPSVSIPAMNIKQWESKNG